LISFKVLIANSLNPFLLLGPSHTQFKPHCDLMSRLPVIQCMPCLATAIPSQVYESLRQAGDVPEETLEYFTQDGGDALVYELRFLAVENRSDPACYIANNQLDEHVNVPSLSVSTLDTIPTSKQHTAAPTSSLACAQRVFTIARMSFPPSSAHVAYRAITAA
jgi:hypothetical protein